MRWVDAFYGPFPSLLISAALLAVVLLLNWRGTGRKILLVICILLFARYMLWRGLYTLNLDSGWTMAVSLVLFLAEVYGFVQLLLFSYQAWSPTERRPEPIKTYPSVDIMVTVVDEPLYVLRRTLMGCRAQNYPSDRLEIYVLDDGKRPDVKSLADELGVSYLTREDRTHAKAGNLNAALQRSSGALIAVFDVDHVPVPDFLQKTVGFFEDETVAIVQTAQDFYNQDIFQQSVSRNQNLRNEQALFFRTLQAGRDRHNSAFFAGSSGLLRRTALESIGGFQTETLTEDLHTSLFLHAKGYRSCYLNETLTSGLMPESFEGHIKQRARWAMGTSQVLVRNNPLFMKGLTWPQRVDYFGSILYFYFGIPRIIFLIAPLSWVLFSIPALKADTGPLINFFFSAYLASILAIRGISRNTRSAFWSDVHETVMCFAATRATIVGLFSANRTRKFEVTPKGSRFETSGFANASSIGWHLLVFGLLIFAIATGLLQLFGPAPTPGLGISIGWASFNVVLLSAAIMSAHRQRQLRNFIRRVSKLPCSIIKGSKQMDAKILDISESGMAVHIQAPWYTLKEDIDIEFVTETNERLTLMGRIVRQELDSEGGAIIGIEFEDLDTGTVQTLIGSSFSSSDDREEEYQIAGGMGVIRSFATLLSVLPRLREQPQPSRRRTPRLPLSKPCRLEFGGKVLLGVMQDASYSGATALFSTVFDVSSQSCTLSIGEVELKVNPVECVKQGRETLVRFQVGTIEKGASQWHAWHQSPSR